MIAGILNGLARWVGLAALGMKQILLGECVLWAKVGLLVSVIFCKVMGLGIAMAAHNIRFAMLRFVWNDITRIMQLGLGISTIIGLLWLWCLNQPYLLITTVFPVVSI